MRHYRQLTQEERYQIAALWKLERSQSEIADALGRSQSTVSRELKRNGMRGHYRAEPAQQRSDKRRRSAAKRHKRLPCVEAWVSARLREDFSPEQVVGEARRLGYVLVSHEWIYQFVARDQKAGGDLYRHLRHRRRRYRKRYGSQDRRGRLVNRVGIEHRPTVVEQRSRLGDWEGDTIVGSGQAALVSLVDRRSGYLELAKVSRATAAHTSAIIISRLSLWKDRTHTATFDNGREFAGHEQIAAALDARVYFADPYSSWQRGTNENTNGLVRQYFPKGTNFDTIKDDEIATVAMKLNLRPRKRLAYRSPFDVFHGCSFDAAA